MKGLKLLIVLFFLILNCGTSHATQYVSAYGLKLKAPFACEKVDLATALDKLVTQFAADNHWKLTSDFVVINEELKKRTRGLPFKSEELVFGALLTELFDAYGVCFRLAGDALVVFDPVTDVISNRYSGFVRIPEGLKADWTEINGESRLEVWFREKGLVIWDGEKIEIAPGSSGRIFLCEGRVKLRNQLAFVLERELAEEEAEK